MDTVTAAKMAADKLAKIEECFVNAGAIWETIDVEAQQAILDYRNGAGSIPHCILSGLNASEGIADIAKNGLPDTKDVIDAECHSDDRAFEVEFNAAQWFKIATDDQIRRLDAVSWCDSSETDQIAEYFETKVPDIGSMFQYLGRIHGTSKECGSACSVDRNQAMAWLQANRPELHAELDDSVCDESASYPAL